MSEPTTTAPAKLPRGFARLSPERRIEIARMGGSSPKPENRSFYTNRDLARRAGQIGGKARHGKKPDPVPDAEPME